MISKMKSIKINIFYLNKLCKRSPPSLEETSRFTNNYSKKKQSHKGSLHWSTYKFEPSDKLGQLQRLKNINSVTNLRNLIIHNKTNNSLLPCFINFSSLSYCLYCRSPRHTIDQCNPNHSHLKDAKHDKENGKNTTWSSTKNCKQWLANVKAHSMVSLSTSSIDLNKSTNSKNSFKFKKQNDTSLHQVALPLPKRSMKNNQC